MSEQIIVIGVGLAGLSAAHTVLEHGGRVLLLDKCPFLGGNSTKATSGINGAPTRTQAAKGINDNADKFEADIIRGAAGVGHTEAPAHTVPLAKVRLRTREPRTVGARDIPKASRVPFSAAARSEKPPGLTFPPSSPRPPRRSSRKAAGAPLTGSWRSSTSTSPLSRSSVRPLTRLT